jgi:hypothetical protein
MEAPPYIEGAWVMAGSSAYSWTGVAVAVMAAAAGVAGAVTAAGDRPLAGQAQGRGDRIWVGPMPFVSERTVRPDYCRTLTDPKAWPTVLGRAGVFKSYLMLLPDVPLPGKTGPEIPDARLRRLARFMRERGIKVAFEVGGLRMGLGRTPGPGWGKACAADEFHWLKRWLDAGGTIDYLTTDHAVMGNISPPYFDPKRQGCGMDLPAVVAQQADYFADMSRRIPGVRVGAIESLGFFHVVGPGGKEYARTVPTLPVWRFDEYLGTLVAAMKRRGLRLDHFHVDFGYEGVLFDGGGKRLDYGRILGVERAAHARGVKTGIIANAFHDQSVPVENAQVASREAHERTLAYLRGYLAAGGRAEHIVLQTWQPYPDTTGPEDQPYTVLNIARDALALPAMKGVR